MFLCPKCNYSLNITKNISYTNKEKINDIQTLINHILDNTEYLTDITKNDIINSDIFKELSTEEKKRVNENLDSKNQKINLAFYSCTSCGYTSKLNDGTIIFKTSFIKHDEDDTTLNDFRIDDNTLPRTKDFICPNNDCKSRKNDKNKEAIFYRPYMNSYLLKYICCDCKTTWQASIE